MDDITLFAITNNARSHQQSGFMEVRPILEYGASIWHRGLIQEQENALEDIQMRACQIGMPYHAGIPCTITTCWHPYPC